MGTLEITLLAALALVAAVAAMVVTAPARRRKRAVDAALGAARAAVAAAPGDRGARVRLGRVLLEVAKRPEEALAQFEPVLAEDPFHWEPGEKPTVAAKGDALADAGRLEDAIETFERFVASVKEFETGGDAERKWQLETHKVEAEQRIRLLRKGDTHVHRPEQWGDAS